jgi:hypothetical protein
MPLAPSQLTRPCSLVADFLTHIRRYPPTSRRSVLGTPTKFKYTKLHTRPVATGVFFLTRFFHNFLKNDAQDLKKMV